MADDYPANTGTSGRLVAGGINSGVLETVNDDDWFAFSMMSGLNYQININATTSTVNPSLLDVTLRNSNGGSVAGFGSADKVLTYVPSVTGIYYVDVGSQSGLATGPYQLTASPLDDYTATPGTTGRLLISSSTVNSSTNGTLEGLNDSDLFAVTVVAGLNYQFNVTAAAGFTNPTTLDVSLYNGNLTGLAGFGSADKVLTYTATATTTLYLGVTSQSGTGVGGYTLSATPQDDYVASTATTGRITGGNGVASGTLEGQNDSDWFATTLTAGSNYQFNLNASSGFNNPTTLDVSLFNINGVRVAGFGSADKTLSYTPSSSGDYYVGVTSQSGTGTGSYTINTGTVSNSVFRFFDTNTGTQFLTASATERDNVIAMRPDLKYEGVGLNAVASANQPGATAVFRFFDTVYGTHFFTSSDAERQVIVNTRADLKFEGTSFYEYVSQQANSTPVYRFFDSNKGTHFFTASAGENNTIVATRPDLIAEGVSFYAPT